mgnify:CR=1 FL=1
MKKNDIGDFESTRTQSGKIGAGRYEFELYKEEDDICDPVLRVRRIQLSNKGENWRLMRDNKIIETIEGSKLTLAMRSYLHTPEGLTFLVRHFKSDWKGIGHLKSCLKKLI